MSIDSNVVEIEKESLKDRNNTIILDFSFVVFVDEAAVKILKKIFDEYKKEEVTILLANANGKC